MSERDFLRTRISRRQLLRVVGGLTAGATFLPIQSASSDPSPPPSAAASVSKAPVPAAGGEKVLRVGSTQTTDIPSADPHVRTAREIAHLENIMEPLVGFEGETVNSKPLLAERWAVSPDGALWTLNLRKNVKFHDGTIFKAVAVKYAFDRINAIKQSPAYTLLRGKVKELRIVDDYTVQFSVNRGGPPFLQLLTMVLIVSPTAGKANDKGDNATAYFKTNPIGTGPYKLTRWDRGSRQTLEKFDGYWGGWEGAHYTRIIYQIIPEASTQQLMLERGDLDIAQRFPNDSLPKLKQNKDITVQESHGFRVALLRLNVAAGPTKDVRVRKALAHAMDYEGLLKAQTGILGPNSGPVPSIMMGGWAPENLAKYDLNKAATLFKEAGLPTGTKFRIFVTKGFDHLAAGAQILQAGLKKLGYDLEINVVEWSEWSGRVVNWIEKEKSDPSKSPTEMFTLVVPPRLPDAWPYLWFSYNTEAARGAGRNWGQYSVNEVDQLMAKGAETGDLAQRLEIWKQVCRRIVNDQPDLFLGNELRVAVRRADVQHFVFHPAWFPEMHFYPLRPGK